MLAQGETSALSVTGALGVAKARLESASIRVVGEVTDPSNPNQYKAVYFSLRDSQSTLPCMMWRGEFERVGIPLRAGMRIEVEGFFTVYEAKGRLQFKVRSFTLECEGRLRIEIAQRAERLRAEGLMDAARKRTVPTRAERIALVTSGSGKAVHDVLRTLSRRFPVAEVLFFGTQVEGERAPESIVDALRQADGAGADVILLVRGGGSYEDLLPFSSEEVARAVAGTRTPIVTGIGHEPDTSIADMVADRAASTPTAAAESVVPSMDQVASVLARDARALASALERRLTVDVQRMQSVMSRRVLTDPNYVNAQRALTVDELHRRLAQAIPRGMEANRTKLSTAAVSMQVVAARLLDRPRTAVRHSAERLDDLSPLRVLGRGYSATFSADSGSVVSSVQQVSEGSSIVVRLADGQMGCTVDSVMRGDTQK